MPSRSSAAYESVPPKRPPRRPGGADGESGESSSSASGAESGGGSSSDQQADSENKSKQETVGGDGGEVEKSGPDVPIIRDNEDIVARQIREAAEKETDPILKAKLWEEYRKYKKQQTSASASGVNN